MSEAKRQFAAELELLMRKYLGQPVWNEDFDDVLHAAHDVIEKIEDESCAFPSKEDQEEEG
jgi:hypothetical protein